MFSIKCRKNITVEDNKNGMNVLDKKNGQKWAYFNIRC